MDGIKWWAHFNLYPDLIAMLIDFTKNFKHRTKTLMMSIKKLRLCGKTRSLLYSDQEADVEQPTLFYYLTTSTESICLISIC